MEADKKRKYTIISVASVLLVAAVIGTIATIVPSHNNSNSDGGVSTSTKAVKEFCKPTEYKKTCENSLNSAQVNTSDPHQLIVASFEIAVKELQKAVDNSTVLAEAEKDPYTKKALDGCKKLVEFSIDDLKNSLKNLGSFDITKINQYVENIRVWLSAAVGYHETCLDSFDNTTTDAGKKMKDILNVSQQLTVNALSLVKSIENNLGTLESQFQLGSSRRLLEDDESSIPDQEKIPSWVTAGQRRLLQANPAPVLPNVVVAQDGSGKYKTINEALRDIPPNNPKLFVIHVKEGIYNEQVTLTKQMSNVMIVGDGPTKTKVTGRANKVDGTPTWLTATFSAAGSNFIAKDMGFENSAGSEKEQAVALRVQSDFSIIYNCQIDGFQDTLYTHAYRQFYRDCIITGTIDFVFGDAAAVFQNCKLVVRKPLPNQQCIVTAQGRLKSNENTAIVLHNCSITGDPEYIPLKNQNKAYLARPWKDFSRTIFLQCFIDNIVAPEGYLPWQGNMYLNTLFYTEFGNMGPGANTAQRVRWGGIKVIDAKQAANFLPQGFFVDDTWIRQSGVPYVPGLLSV